MGRTILIIFLLFIFSPFRVHAQAQTRSFNIHVSATVLPTPQWTLLLQKHSTISSYPLPFTNLHLYIIHLTDGQILIKNQPVLAIIPGPSSYQAFTNPNGDVQFLLPTSKAEFFYSVTGKLISLNPNPS